MKANRNNKGYSLVELLITIAIFGMVMIGIAMIMRTSSVSYLDGTREVAVQTEVQIVANQVEELLVDATGTMYSGTLDDSGSIDPYWKIDKGDKSHCFRLDTSENKLLYQLRDINTGVNATPSSWSLMADYVTDFEITGWEKRVDGVEPSSYCDNKVTVKIQMDNDGYKYELSRDVFFRNAIEDNTVYQIQGTGTNTSSPTGTVEKYELDRYAVLDLEKEFGITKVTSVTSGFTNNYKFVTPDYNTNNLSVAKAITKVSDAQLDLTAATTPLCIMLNDTNRKDFSKAITESTNAVVTGNTATGSVSVQITTKKVKYLLDDTSVSGDGLVHVNLNAGDFGYTFIGVEGIDVKSMVAIADTLNPGGKPYSYSMVVYYDDGDQEYAYTDANKPKTVTGKTPSLKHEYDGNFGVSLDSNSCGIQKGFALQPDPETNGFLLVTNNDGVQWGNEANKGISEAGTRAAMAAGTYRMSIMIHYPEQSTTGSHDVLDFGVVYMGCPVTNYQGAHTYTATPADFHVAF